MATKKDAEYWNRKAGEAGMSKNFADAFEFAEKALSIDQKHAPTYVTRAAFFVELGDFEKALADYQQFLSLADSDLRMQETVGRVKALISTISILGTSNAKATEMQMRMARREKGHYPIREAVDEGTLETSPEAIIFIDMVGSSEIMSEYGVDHFMKLFWELKGIYSLVAEERGITYIKSLGDGFMAVTKNRKDAVEAMVDFVSRISVRNKKRSDDQKMNVRVGIAFGQVSKDNQGDRFGEAVIFAQRLESFRLDDAKDIEVSETYGINSENRIYICKSTHKDVEKTFPCLLLGKFELKGLQHDRAVYVVDWEKGAKKKK